MKSIKILLFVFIASLMFASCSNNAKTPSEIAKKIFIAAKNLDFNTIKPYLVKERMDDLEEAEKELTENVEEASRFRNSVKNITFKVISERISEDENSAVVEMRFFYADEDDESRSIDIDFVKIDGEWKVDFNLF